MLDEKRPDPGLFSQAKPETGNGEKAQRKRNRFGQSGNVGEISSVIPARLHEFLVNFFSYNLENTSSEGDTLLHR